MRPSDRPDAASSSRGGSPLGGSPSQLRALVERRLAVAARAAASDDPRARMLRSVEGPVSRAMRDALEQPAREAAVLLPLVERADGFTVLFTERAPHLAHHPGQISFPGGRIDGAHEDAVQAALREAWEEVRLSPAEVVVAGVLPPHITGTGFNVTPVVGFVGGEFEPRPDPAEVAAVFEVPLEFVMTPGNLRMASRERLGTRFRVHELTYGEHLIWGATAAMLATFKELISHE